MKRAEQSNRGAPFLPMRPEDFYFAAVPPPGTTMSKAGTSFNIPPPPLPENLLNIEAPTYSSVTGEPIWQQRTGLQLGSFDPYEDSPYNIWTKGVQFYTPYRGKNIKQNLLPVITPRAADTDVWGNTMSSYSQINRERGKRMGPVDIEYECRGNACAPSSASLGIPVDNVSQETLLFGIDAPLPVQLPGQYPNVGEYTARYIGRNTEDYPQPVNAIVELQRRRIGLPPTPIPSDYDKELLKQLRQGFVIG